MLIIPLQRLTRKEKNADNFQWYKDAANFYIGACNFQAGVTSIMEEDKIPKWQEMNNLLKLYNNDIPASWFKHMTQPVTGKKDFLPAKIRPLNILRPNIDYLNSTYRKRPLKFTVVNFEEDAYNSYIEQKAQYAANIMRQRFIQKVKGPDGSEQEEDGTPEKLLDGFSQSYRDALAAKAQSFVDNQLIIKHDLPEKWAQLFLDYSIVGEPASYRSIENGKLVYRVIPKQNLQCGKTSQSNYLEDAPWAVERMELTTNEIVEKFYTMITEEDWKKIEDNQTFSAGNFSRFIDKHVNAGDRQHTVYHVVWRGFKQITIVYRPDESGQMQEIEADEDYVAMQGEYVEKSWRSQLYHTYKAGNDLYFDIGEFQYAISDANLMGSTKLPYNGITFGYQTDKVFSPLKMGIPYLIMYLIVNFTAEKLLAKHKGKVILFQEGIIPKTNGWTEDKFLQYLEAKGYMVVNPSQPGVDRSLNTGGYAQSIDMGQLGDINQLMSMGSFYEESWNNIIGVSRQARGQNMASDQVGTTRSSVIQTTVTIDYIYQKFDDFRQREIQYLLELTKLLTLNGHKSLISRDDEASELLEIFPGELLINLGIKTVDGGQEAEDLTRIKEYAQSVNQQDPLLITAIMTSKNIAQLKKVLTGIQRKQQEAQQSNAQSEHDNALELEGMKEQLLKVQSSLDTDFMLQEYEQKKEIEYIKGDVAVMTAKTVNPETDTNNDGMVDVNDIVQRSLDRTSKENIELQKLQVEREKIAADERMSKEKNKTMLANKTSGEK